MKKMFVFPMIAAALSMSMFAACSSDESDDSKSPSGPVADAPADPGATAPGTDDPNATTPGTENPGAGEQITLPTTTDLPPVRVATENTFPKNESVGALDTANYNYYGAELTGRDQFTYGRFEARMKMVSIPGSVSSMFLYYDPSYLLDNEPWNEIDIEVLGKNPGEWQSNLITREPNVMLEDGTKKTGIKQTSEYVTGFGYDATADFHLFALIWTPEYISWEIDSVEVRRDVLGMETKTVHDQVAFMTEQQSLRFNLWASKSAAWVGKFTGEELADGPKEQVIDYVRVYKYDLATKTFTLDWQDDFEGTALDPTHWSAGDWEMERVELNEKNVVVEDGYCKLRMSRELKPGAVVPAAPAETPATDVPATDTPAVETPATEPAVDAPAVEPTPAA